MKIAIFGGNGQLGKTFLNNKTVADKVTFLSFGRDFLNNLNVILEELVEFEPDYILNCVAFTEVDSAETNKILTQEINTNVPLKLALLAKDLKSPFIHISTDFVFSGTKTSPWEVDDFRNPVNFYGFTKARGEDLVLSAYPEGSYIFRTAWLYSPFKNNFVKSVLRKALFSADPLYVVNDQVGQPTSAFELTNQIIFSLDNGLIPGIYHATNSGETSWYEFAREILKIAGENSDRVFPISSAKLSRLAPRPSYSVLSHACWENSGVNPMRNWREALAEQIGEIKSAVIAEGIQ